jgi:hypothetical protein
MTGPSSVPRGERLITRVETVFVPASGEHYDADPGALADVAVLPAPTPANRANRRAARKQRQR